MQNQESQSINHNKKNKGRKGLSHDIIQFYKPYQQNKDNYKTSTLKDINKIQFQFTVPKEYNVIEIIGSGAYGVVCAAEKQSDKKQGHMIAIKKISRPFEHKILAKRMLRELHLLKLLNHQNLIKIETIFMPFSREQFQEIYIAFQFMETDLHMILKSQQELSKQHEREFLYQIIRGLKYIHSAGIAHRDLKPRNLLLNQNCDLKICDFGLARSLMHKSKTNQLTDYVATRWYRAPELLFGSYKYDQTVDMWSVGCIFAEIILRKPFMRGSCTREQLQIISKMIGTEGLSQIESIPEGGRKLMKKLAVNNGDGQINQKFSNIDPIELDILKRLLAINPKQRITADQALKHPYFQELYEQKEQKRYSPFVAVDFQFEEHKLNTQQLKGNLLIIYFLDILYEEILTYNFIQFSQEYEQKRKNNKSLIYHILKNSNKNNRDPIADQSEQQYNEFEQ